MASGRSRASRSSAATRNGVQKRVQKKTQPSHQQAMGFNPMQMQQRFGNSGTAGLMQMMMDEEESQTARSVSQQQAMAPAAQDDDDAAVQAKCEQCEKEGNSSAHSSTQEHNPVQMWDCRKSKYEKPTCVQPKAESQAEIYQAKCAECEKANAAPQAKGNGPGEPGDREPKSIRKIAEDGLAHATQTLPHLSLLQAAFGHHDLSSVRVAIGGAAARSAERIGALAYTFGDRIAFRYSPNLHLTAHEAAHTVQQRAGIQVPGNVGQPGDRWEQHADRVADAVLAGNSAEPILDELSGGKSGSEGDTGNVNITVQRRLTRAPVRLLERELVGNSPENTGQSSDNSPAPASTEKSKENNNNSETEENTEAATQEEGQPERSQEAAEEENSGGGSMGTCYNAGSPPPPDDTPEPKQDEQSTDAEAESNVTFPAWEEPDDIAECEVGEAIEQASQQIPTEVASEDSSAASTMASNTAPGGGESQAPAKDVAAQVAAGDEGLEGASFSSVESQRDTAIADYHDTADRLSAVAPKARGLSRGITFSKRPTSVGEQLRQNTAVDQIQAFMATASGHIQSALVFATGGMPAQLASTAATAMAIISGAIESEKARVSARINAARAAAITGAQASKAQIMAQYAANVALVNAETDAAIAALNAEYQNTTAGLTQREESALTDINQRFLNGRQVHIDKGKEYGARAIATGQRHVDNYESCKINSDKESYGDDGFWDGCLSVRRARAQQDAACQTASGFYESMQRMAQEKGYNLREQRTQYRCAVISGRSQIQSTLDSTLAQLLEGLESGRNGVIEGLTQAQDMNMRGVDGALGATLASLDRQEYQQRQAINDSGYVQQVAIELMAHSTASSLGRGVLSALDMLTNTLTTLEQQLTSGESPDPEALAQALTSAQTGVAQGMDELLSTMAQGAQSAEQQLFEGALGADSALADIATNNDQITSTSEAQFNTQLSALVSGADAAITQLALSHVQQTQETTVQGTTSMQEMLTGFDNAVSQITAKVDEALATSITELETDLQNMEQQLDTKIVAEAWKAAKKEQPAWKGVVAVVLIILVVIASVVISVLTLGAGAPFLAVVLVGAIVGAITAGLIQVINNWAAGEAWDKGLVQAMVMGAVGGALGGAIGAGANGLAQAAVQGAIKAGASTAARAAINLGINLAGDMIAEGATQTFGYLAYGQKFNWQGFVMAGGMSVASTARGGVAGTPRGADVIVPAPSAGRSVRGAMIDTGIGVGLAGSVELIDWATGGDFDFTRFASSAAGGAAGARASARGRAGGARTTAPETPTTGLGRVKQRVTNTRDRIFKGLEISDTSRASQFVSGRMAATEEFFAGKGTTPQAKRTVDSPSIESRKQTTTSDAAPENQPLSPQKPTQDLAATGASKEIRIGNEEHTVNAKRTSTGKVAITLCSACTRIASLLDTLAKTTLKNHKARKDIENMAQQARDLEADITAGKIPESEIPDRVAAFAERLKAEASKYDNTVSQALLGKDFDPDTVRFREEARLEKPTAFDKIEKYLGTKPPPVPEGYVVVGDKIIRRKPPKEKLVQLILHNDLIEVAHGFVDRSPTLEATVKRVGHGDPNNPNDPKTIESQKELLEIQTIANKPKPLRTDAEIERLTELRRKYPAEDLNATLNASLKGLSSKQELTPAEKNDLAALESKTHNERTDAENARLKALRQRLAAKALDERQDTSLSQGQQNKRTEQLGELAADQFVGRKFPDAKKVFEGTGSGVLDRLYQNTKPPPKFIVAEAKGGSATNTSSRESGEQRLQQGRKDYLLSVLSDIRTQNQMPTKMRLRLIDALKNKEVKYLEVTQKLTDQGEISDIKVREYIL